MHVLCASHESLRHWLKEFKEIKAEVARLKATNDKLAAMINKGEMRRYEANQESKKLREALEAIKPRITQNPLLAVEIVDKALNEHKETDGKIRKGS